MAENISPEERLLRLIRKSKKEGSRQPLQTSVAEQKISAITSNIAAKPKHSIIPKISVSQSILFILAASFLFMLSAFVYQFLGYKITPPVKPKGENKTPFFQKEIPPFENYVADIKNNSIFTNAVTPETSKQVINAASSEAIKDFNLIGIVSGANPQAILENKSLQKTYYLSKGQGIGEFIIEDIQEGKIILSHNGQRYELHL